MHEKKILGLPWFQFLDPPLVRAMDVLVSVALDEVCASLSTGLPVTGLWTRLSGEFEAAGLPLGLSVKSILFARLIALPHISLMERKQGKPDDTLVHSAAKTVEAAERRGALLFASPDLRDKFLGIYDHRYSASKLSTKQKETLERVGASRCTLMCHLSKIVVSSYTLFVLLQLQSSCEIVYLLNMEIFHIDSVYIPHGCLLKGGSECAHCSNSHKYEWTFELAVLLYRRYLNLFASVKQCSYMYY